MDSLALSSCPGSVRHRLPTLPDTLDRAYADTMRRIQDQAPEDFSLANVVLSWLSTVVRPLTKWELIHAISTRSGQEDISRSRLPIEELLTSVCAGLVMIEEETFIIRLVHATAQEYFRRMRRRFFPKSGKNVARTCITYLSFDVFDKGPCSSRLELQTRLHNYPFYSYAASHWAAHMWGHREKSFEVPIRDFLLAKRKVASAIQCRNSASDLATFDMYPRNVSPLSYTASLGLTYTVELLTSTCDIEGKDSLGATALMRAVQSGFGSTVFALLQAGAEVNTAGPHGITPLIVAASKGDLDVVQALLEKGADPNARSHGWVTYGTAFEVAARSGHVAVVQVLQEVTNSPVQSPRVRSSHGKRSRPSTSRRMSTKSKSSAVPTITEKSILTDKPISTDQPAFTEEPMFTEEPEEMEQPQERKKWWNPSQWKGLPIGNSFDSFRKRASSLRSILTILDPPETHLIRRASGSSSRHRHIFLSRKQLAIRELEWAREMESDVVEA